MLTRRSFLMTAAAAVTLRAAKKPNVIVIVGDDLGWSSISAQGSDIPTPNIDSIGKNGIRFTNGYVSCPVCSPTRAGLITGRYQQRFGHELNPGPAGQAESDFGLPLTEKTFPQYMKELGYSTGMVGKWHLGYKPEMIPTKRGFDEFFGFLGGAHSYIDSRADGANPIMRGSETVEEKEYLTDAFNREAVSYIDRHSREPFFLYLTYNAVHTPMHASERLISNFKHISDEKRRSFATMLTAMDEGVGQVLAKLREKRIEEDTLVVFISDNGGPTQANTSTNTPLRGFKGQVYEGGVRVPFLMQWRSTLPKGKVYEEPVIALDLLPTALAAAGGTRPPNADGVDLTPFLTGKRKDSPHDALYWRFGAQFAIRKGDWKLLRTDAGAAELYNVRADVGESKNLADSEPARLKELQSAYEEWNSQMVPPKWNTRRQRPGARRRRK